MCHNRTIIPCHQAAMIGGLPRDVIVFAIALSPIIQVTLQRGAVH